MLAQRENLNILHNDQFVMVLHKGSVVHQVSNVLHITLCEPEHCFGITLRGPEKAFPFGILAHTLQDSLYSSC